MTPNTEQATKITLDDSGEIDEISGTGPFHTLKNLKPHEPVLNQYLTIFISQCTPHPLRCLMRLLTRKKPMNKDEVFAFFEA